MDVCLVEQSALRVLLMIFCLFPEPWRTWKIIPLYSPPWDPSTTSFHSEWRGCLGWLHQDHLTAPYRCSTSRGCRSGVLILVILAVQSGPVLLLIPGVGNFIQFWPLVLKLTFWNWHKLHKGSLLSPLYYLFQNIYIYILQCWTDLFLFCKSLRKVLWIYSLLISVYTVISVYQLRKLNCELSSYCWTKEFYALTFF